MRFVTWAKVRIIGLVAAVYIVAFIGTTPGSSRAATTTPTATLGTTPSATPLPKPSGFPARAITLPDEKSGAITLPGSTDRYIFYAEFNQIVSIGVFTSDAGFGPTLDLAAPDATVLATATGADSALIAGAQLPVSGAYIVTVRPAKTGQVGRYALRVSKGATLRDLDGDALRVGAVVRGQIEQIGDRQTWSFDARGGTNFWVLARPARGSSLDPVIEIVNPTGETIASAHDLSKTNSAGTPPIPVRVSGRYLVRVTSYQNAARGGYELTVYLANQTPPTASRGTPPPIQVTAEVQLRAGERYTAFFKGVSGQAVTIRIASKPEDTPGLGFDPILEVFGPSGRRAAYADDSADSPDPLLKFALNDGDGVYTVKVSSFALQSGAFTLTINSP